jgi:diaminopimelate epimerase
MGNDFVLVDGRHLRYRWSSLAPRVCDRHFGIGADGLIIVGLSKVATYRMRIFNPDGSEAETCGNGLRCFTRHIIESGFTRKTEFTVETLANVSRVHAEVKSGLIKQVTVEMGGPILSPSRVPIRTQTSNEPLLAHPMKVKGYNLVLAIVSMGNPHAVAFVDKPLSDFPLATIGPLVENHPLFPERTNFEIARVINRKRIEMRVWERGAGETLACGSGACAVAVASYLKGLTDETVSIVLSSGTLRVSWNGSGPVRLTGPAEKVYSGEFYI